MTTIEFNKKCQPLNLAYREIFGEIPSFFRYACTQETYLQALQEAIEKKAPLDTMLTPVVRPVEAGTLT